MQMLRPFIYLTSFSVMFFLTEFALHTHLNAFGAGTMTALYAAAMVLLIRLIAMRFKFRLPEAHSVPARQRWHLKYPHLRLPKE